MKEDTKLYLARTAMQRLGRAKRTKLAIEVAHPTDFWSRASWSYANDDYVGALVALEAYALEMTAEGT